MSQDPHRLAKALRDYGTGQMPNLWSLLSQIDISTYIMAGELDAKFVKLHKN